MYKITTGLFSQGLFEVQVGPETPLREYIYLLCSLTWFPPLIGVILVYCFLAIEIYDVNKPGITKVCQGQKVFYQWRLHVHYRDLLSDLIFLNE